jgi:rubredoxin
MESKSTRRILKEVYSAKTFESSTPKSKATPTSNGLDKMVECSCFSKKKAVFRPRLPEPVDPEKPKKKPKPQLDQLVCPDCGKIRTISHELAPDSPRNPMNRYV